MTRDHHFDQLAPRFSRNIYGNIKGQLRLALLQEDLTPWLNRPPCQVLDAGGGQGQMSALWAKNGHQVTLVDAAQPMLDQASELLSEQGLNDQVHLVHSALQQYLPSAPRFEVVLCHAVLEWTRDPQAVIALLSERLAEGGVMSLMFYNRHSLVLRNAMGGILNKLQEDKVAGDGRKLTPTNPIVPQQLYGWLEELKLEVLLQRGVRCLFDYMPRVTQRSAELEPMLALERPLREQEPYLHMARYIHLVLRHSPAA